MRWYPHDPDEATVVENQAVSLSLIDVDEGAIRAAREAGNVPFFSINARQSFSAAAGAYALERPAAEVLAHLAAAAAHHATAIELGEPHDPEDRGVYLSAAIVAGERASATRLVTRPQVTASSPDAALLEALDATGDAEAELAFGTAGAARARLEAASSALAAARLSRSTREPLLGVMTIAQAVIAGDGAALDRAIQARHDALARILRRPSLREMPDGLLDIWGLAFLGLGLTRGLVPSVESVYLPLHLVQAS